MKASEIIEKLQQLVVEHGDLYVFESFSGGGVHEASLQCIMI